MADLLNVRVSAPGKVILFGEHAVVYGKLAVAASLDLRTYVTFKEEKGNKLQIHFENLDFEKKFHITVLNSILKNTDFNSFKEKYSTMWKHPETLNANEFVSIIKKSLNINSEPLSSDHFKRMMSFFCIYFGMFLSSNTNVFPANVSVKSSLSLGSGTGSSASFMGSLAAAVLRMICSKNPAAYPGDSSDGHDLKSSTFNEIELNLISKWAYFAEKIIHGNPSGIDNTICTYGSFLSFRKTRAPIPIIIKPNIEGLLVDTMVPKNTLALVEKVAQLNEKHPKIFENIFNTIECIADEAIDTLIQLSETSENDKELIQKHYKCLKELTAMNHHLLRSLEVSHPSLEKVIEIMKKHNVVGKLTGAGGGGYAIALIPSINGHSDVSQLCNELSMEGYTANIVKLGAPDVRIEE